MVYNRIGAPAGSFLFPLGSWTEITFIDSFELEMDLCADRARFLLRRDIMKLIPRDIKKRIAHHSAEAHVTGFEQLFEHTTSQPNLVSAYQSLL